MSVWRTLFSAASPWPGLLKLKTLHLLKKSRLAIPLMDGRPSETFGQITCRSLPMETRTDFSLEFLFRTVWTLEASWNLPYGTVLREKNIGITILRETTVQNASFTLLWISKRELQFCIRLLSRYNFVYLRFSRLLNTICITTTEYCLENHAR